ncbi:MAG: L,D-transpeptidase [Casimicrobiaceae bacterium]|nr:L,D-transpeptidase [Casimicrobiaceae bacterium]MDW8312724.1 L,D-transpeptidase [Burkholderiales bacterium]
MRAGRLREAERLIDGLIERYPNYRLAHLIKGDLLAARTRPLTELGSVPASLLSAQVVVPTAFPTRRPTTQSGAEAVQELRAEARARLASVQEGVPRHRVPAEALRIAGDVNHVFAVDASRSRLYVLEHRGGRLTVIADFYASVGKAGLGKTREGDKRTPTGTYFLVGEVPRERLNDFYGDGAYEIDFPSPWDHRLGRTGSGIWLHGTPASTFARAPRASDGCIVVSNADLEKLRRWITPGRTPIIVGESLQWVEPEAASRAAQGVLAAFERWRVDFLSRDASRIARHYEGHERVSQAAQAPRVVPVSRKVPAIHLPAGPIALTNVTALGFAGEPDVVLMSFDRSIGHHRDRVRQYWQRRGGVWHIVHESASLP